MARSQSLKLSFAAVLLALVAGQAAGRASAAAVQPANQAASPAAVAKPADIPASTKAALEKSLAAYRALTSYRDSAIVKMDAKFKDGKEPDGPRIMDQETTLVWAAPNKVAMVAPFMQVFSDGQQVSVTMAGLNQYMQGPLPATFEPEKEPDMSKASAATWLGQHDIALLLMRRPVEAKDLLAGVESWGEAKPDKLDGEAGVRIGGKIAGNLMTGGESETAFTVFISDATGLIREIRRDMTEMYRESLSMHGGDEDEVDGREKKPELEKAEWVYKFEKVKTNETVPDSEFVFKPEDSAKKVEKFNFNAGRGGGGDPQFALIGKPAPAIKAKMLDGTEFNLDSLKGRIVLMDFWATWCGPCVQAIPKVQKVADKFADRNVTILGINQDRGDTEKVSAFLKKKNITLKQVMDDEGEIGSAYGVRGIPCLVVVNGQGVIEDIHVGAGPTIERELTEAIEKLLRGEAIHTPEEIAELHKQAEATGDEDDAQAAAVSTKPGGDGKDADAHDDNASGALEPLNPDKLAPGKKISLAGGWQSFRRDVDGDGREELIVPDSESGMTIIAADGSTTKKVKFRGAGQFSVTSAAAVTIDGQAGWAIAGSKYDMGGGGGGQRPVIGFFDEGGKSVWQFKPDLGAKASTQQWIDAADLDGDGKPEIVLLLTTYELKKLRANEFENSNPKSVLIVLNDKGEVLSRRRAGEYAQSLWIPPATAPNAPRPIVVISADGARTFTYTK